MRRSAWRLAGGNWLGAPAVASCRGRKPRTAAAPDELARRTEFDAANLGRAFVPWTPPGRD